MKGFRQFVYSETLRNSAVLSYVLPVKPTEIIKIMLLIKHPIDTHRDDY